MEDSTLLDQSSPEMLVHDGLNRIDEAAEFLGLSRSQIYALMEAQELVYVKIGRSRRIPRRALIEFAARCLRGA
jgi:excisionase family DNA binding protein